MRVQALTFFAIFATALSADWPFNVTELQAPDGSITAKFVPFGSTLTELWVKDKDGKARDVVLGYDDNTQLRDDPGHPVFNAVAGRYAGRINGGLFSIPISKAPDPTAANTWHIPTNDANGTVTLHGGIIGWDRRNWTVAAQTPTSVTFEHIDPADEGFPGIVTVQAHHEVTNGGVLRSTIRAKATQLTPIMITQHIYWNLDAFQDGTDNILEHKLKLDSSTVLALNETNSIPTGKLIDVTNTPYDFRTERTFGSKWNDTPKICPGCYGYNSGFVLDKKIDTPITLSSKKSGIKLSIQTDQAAAVVYTAWWLNAPRKAVHGGPSKSYLNSSAVAIEQQGYIDAINTPEFHQNQIYGPSKDYEWQSVYKFSTL
ncbi:galactose mutarotase-like protein [Crepidotus variabilis]|uniref:Galactose mutarotase-like protein n=1 Tax=Crepidotus variabilis TaxID=179855 RepID=A0A9P6EQ35_9AGAR|nr:galactose mutarotase-like protein [Crepidotus variabilis]